MKIITIPRNGLLVSAALIISLAGQTFSGYKNTEELRGHIYQKFSVPTINRLQKIKAKVSYALLVAQQSLDKDTHNKRIASIDSQFKTIENNLRTQEKNAVIVILKKCNIDDEVVDFTFNTLDELKKFGTEYMNAPQENIFHDETIPTHLYELIIKHLQKNDIHPGSIRIVDAINDEHKDVTEDAIAMAPYHSWSINKHKLIIQKEQPALYGGIILFPNAVRNISIEGQEAMIAHECRHLKEQHSVTCGIIQACLRSLMPDYNDEKLFESNEWKKLKHIHEQQAEIFPCLDDAITTSQLRKMRGAHPYTGMLYESHYNQISSIDELWKQRVWLKSYYTQ
jgi:hypothetical protein